MTYLVAVYFAARNKKDVIEGFFYWTICNFFWLGKIPIDPLKAILFFFILW